ncbi:uncharacterized protein A1O9_09178 [Exophiala aquamarina CBS 119918]|uniref:F-box domain-containing protein n=1 Tax=Exophiala aquamarina CBS 119918 TaxID=1182545 RepID=A0A072P4H5_9EURO|nr:uncharacterized protein A1O9_09178 [Exophiala aquamarina CBS 119918]KEF54736.1 hypothetical protein A1O9_09178 [Exophiala aquamarina CBS 119918]
MAMQELAPEILVHIFEALSSASDIINLSLTCRCFHTLLPSSQKLTLFYNAMDQTMGPVEEIIQLLTFNGNQLLHIRRTPPLSYALLTQIAHVGRVGQRFVALYPTLKWVEDQSVNRRFLRKDEARRLRRAVYRFWFYSQAFHSSPAYRYLRSNTTSSERLQLLRGWPTEDLLDFEDFRGILEQLLASEICPTDGDVYSRHQEDARVGFQTCHRSAGWVDPSIMFPDLFHSSRDEATLVESTKLTVQELRFKHMRGWGTDLDNFYLVQAFLKLTPVQMLWLYDNAVSKADVERYLEEQTHDICFLESGSLVFQDWVTILHQRGIDVQQVREGIWDGVCGIGVD